MLAIGRKYRSRLEEGLKRHTREDIFWLPDNPAVDERLAGHADLNVFSGNGAIVVAKGLYSYIVKELTNIGVPVLPSGEQNSVILRMQVSASAEQGDIRYTTRKHRILCWSRIWILIAFS